MKRSAAPNPITEAFYTDAEERANRFNIRCLAILFFCSLACLLLNEIGIFTAEPALLRISALSGAAVSLVPVAVWAVHDRLLKRLPSACRKAWFRPFILCFMYLTMAIFCLTLSHHAVCFSRCRPCLPRSTGTDPARMRWCWC